MIHAETMDKQWHHGRMVWWLIKGSKKKTDLPNSTPSIWTMYKAAKLRDEVAQLEREQVPTLKGETCP